MFYFIGSGTAIKKEVIESDNSSTSYKKIKNTKMILFPHLTLNMFLIGTVFVLGGAVETGAVTGIIHGVLFIIAFLHFLYTIRIKHIGFKENIDVIIELADINETKSIAN